MNLAVNPPSDPQQTASAVAAVSAEDLSSLQRAVARACAKIAPLWPLKHFVAVNPFLGFSGQTFHATCATLRRVANADMLMPRDFYRRALTAGEIEDEDIAAALSESPAGDAPFASVQAVKDALERDAARLNKPSAVVATVAEVLDALASGDRQASRTAFMIDEISKWCAAYFDEGQSVWRLPARRLRPYAAWRASMRHDRNPEVFGIKGFRAAIARTPEEPVKAIGAVIEALGVPERAIEDYLHRALFDIGGWAGYARYLVWESELYGREDDTLVQLLAIRVVWGYALFLERRDAAFKDAWSQAMQSAAALPHDERLGDDPDLCVDLIMQDAFEAAWRRRLLARLAPRPAASRPTPARAPLQAAFCIDVRSEVFRRSLETIAPEVETIGFAGFFGFPIEYVPIGRVKGGAQCPVLLKPAVIVCEAVERASPDEEAGILKLRLLRRRAAKAWKSFKLSAVSSFTYVETAGLLFLGKIASDSLGLTRPVQDPNSDGIDSGVLDRIGPRIEPREVGGRETGFNDSQRVAMAEAALRAMSLTSGFAPLVVVVGHGGSSVNNPHASGLDCGACGGHTGEANARVAAAILNDPVVRVGLKARGIKIPEDSWFLGALHDTTTDDIKIFNAEQAPASHAAAVKQLRSWCDQAAALARMERAALLGVPQGKGAGRQVIARSRDWSQVRPEWGLAGNAAFIAAPRERTLGVNLGGRAFLHNYDWSKDASFSVLELIMTAPMVVASWINLQYYGSTVNNRAFGAGNKTLHNVTGVIGVLEGNAGDLRVGLPFQSVHDGSRFVHEPLRLHVFIEAPVEAINAVIEKHPAVRDLADHRWIHLFAISDDGRPLQRYQGQLRWANAS